MVLIAIHFFQCFGQAFLIEHGAVARYNNGGKHLVIQRGDKSRWRLHVVAYCGKHRLKKLLEITLGQEALFKILK